MKTNDLDELQTRLLQLEERVVGQGAKIEAQTARNKELKEQLRLKSGKQPGGQT